MPDGGSVNQMESSDLTTNDVVVKSDDSIWFTDPPSGIGAGDAPAAVLAGDEAALAVARVAVGVIGGLAEHADPPGLLVPAHDAVVGNIAPQEAARVAEIDRPLVEAAAGGDAFDAGERDAIFLEARIEHLDGGIRVALARLPAGERPRVDGRRKSAGARGSQHLPSCALHWYPPRRDLAGSRSATILARRSRV